jgi:EmrB/QacA subfamily drug resistance transporter
VYASLLLASGRIADVNGRRRVWFVGLGTFLAGSALAGLAPSPAILIAARVVQAVGGALLTPTSLALLLPEFPIERRSMAIGIWGAVGAVAAALGPSLGSAIVDGAGWRWVFYINVPVGVAAWLAGRRLLVESRDPEARGVPDLVGVVLSAAAVGSLALAIVQSDAWGWGDARVVLAMAVAAALGPLFVWRCVRHRSPVLDLTLFRIRSFAVANVTALLFGISFFGMLLANILFLTGVWGYSIFGAGLAVTPGPLVAAMFAPPAGRIADRVGHRSLIVPGILLFAAGMVWYAAAAGTEPAYWSRWFPATLVVGAGVGLTISTLSSAAVVGLPPARFAIGTATNSTARLLGSVLGVAILVAITGERSPADLPAAFDRAWGLFAVIALAAAAVALLLPRRPAWAEATSEAATSPARPTAAAAPGTAGGGPGRPAG